MFICDVKDACGAEPWTELYRDHDFRTDCQDGLRTISVGERAHDSARTDDSQCGRLGATVTTTAADADAEPGMSSFAPLWCEYPSPP
jgi:hypothetical protein